MIFKLKTISVVLAALALSTPALAQSYKFKSYSPGVKSNAGVLTANPANPTNPTQPEVPKEPEPLVSSLVFSSVTPVNLGAVQRGAPNGAVVDITARDGDVSLVGMSIQGAYSPPFIIGSTTCSQTLSKDQTCSATVSFESENATGAHEGTIRVDYRDSKSDLKALSTQVSASMVFGRVAYSVPTLNFPATDVAKVSSALTARLSNSGTGTLTVNSISAPAGFNLTSVSCDTASGNQSTLPVTLRSSSQSEDGCTVALTFAPTAPINYSGVLAVTSDNYGGAPLLTLTGSGQTPIDYATMINTGYQSNLLTMSNGNLTGTWPTNTSNASLYRTNKVRSSGKYYVEFTTNNLKTFSIGIMRNAASITRGVGYFGTDFGFWDGHAAFHPTSARTKSPNVITSGVANWALPGDGLVSTTVGMKIDLNTGVVTLVGSDCADKSVITLGNLGTDNFAPAIVSNPNPGSSFTANLGQFPTNCPVPAGFNKGWF